MNRPMNRLLTGACVASLMALTIGLVTAAPAADDAKEKKTIVETAIAAKDFKTLVSALKAAELVETLSGEGPFTVFAPTDEAFEAVPAEQLQALLKDKEALQGVLTYHVVEGKVMAADVVKLTEAETVQGEKVKIAMDGDKVQINGANVVATDIECSNGVIHVIDAVLLPPAK